MEITGNPVKDWSRSGVNGAGPSGDPPINLSGNLMLDWSHAEGNETKTSVSYPGGRPPGLEIPLPGCCVKKGADDCPEEEGLREHKPHKCLCCCGCCCLCNHCCCCCSCLHHLLKDDCGRCRLCNLCCGCCCCNECGWRFLDAHCYAMTYPYNPWYFDRRDGGVYSAYGYGAPMTVPLAPTVTNQYNYGWGVPSGRLTPISRVAPYPGAMTAAVAP